VRLNPRTLRCQSSWSGNAVAGVRVLRRLIESEPVEPHDFFPSQFVCGPPAHGLHTDRGRGRATLPDMGFNRRKMEDERRRAAGHEAVARRATDAQVLEDAERLVVAWNERQAKRMPMLFAPTIRAAIAARHWFLWIYCPACRNTSSVDPRRLDRHHAAAVTSLKEWPVLLRPNSPGEWVLERAWRSE
jgi:hypothetical protein